MWLLRADTTALAPKGVARGVCGWTTRSGMKNVKRQELGNELQSSQHLRLQSASCKLLDIPTVPVRDGKVQLKKPIGRIWNVAPQATVNLRSTGQLGDGCSYGVFAAK
jgi:hypothetical protein